MLSIAGVLAGAAGAEVRVYYEVRVRVRGPRLVSLCSAQEISKESTRASLSALRPSVTTLPFFSPGRLSRGLHCHATHHPVPPQALRPPSLALSTLKTPTLPLACAPPSATLLVLVLVLVLNRCPSAPDPEARGAESRRHVGGPGQRQGGQLEETQLRPSIPSRSRSPCRLTPLHCRIWASA